MYRPFPYTFSSFHYPELKVHGWIAGIQDNETKIQGAWGLIDSWSS